MTSVEYETKVSSFVKRFPGTKSYFEQRGTNFHDKLINYFNQPVKKYWFDQNSLENDRQRLKKIIQAMQKAMREPGIGLAHRTHPEDQPLYDNLPSYVRHKSVTLL